MPSIGNATLCVDWREREVKLQLLSVTRNPLRGFAWSSVRTRGKVATFGVPARFPRNPLCGLAWSGVRTGGKVATFRGDAQPFAWIGMVERANAT